MIFAALLVLCTVYCAKSTTVQVTEASNGENNTSVLVLTTSLDLSPNAFATLKSALVEHGVHNVNFHLGKAVEDFAPEALDEARVLLTWSGTRKSVDDVLARAKNLVWIHSRFSGVDGILSPALKESSVVLTNGKGTFSSSLAEFVLGGILYWAKDVPRMLAQKEAKNWMPFEVLEASKQTLCLVGHGDIGRTIAKKAAAGLGMRVLALRRDTGKRDGDEVVERIFAISELKEMLPECDYVAVSLPLTPDTKHLIAEQHFKLMKASAVVLNVGRGPVIDEHALAAALKSGLIRGAFLDVFEVEPLPQDSVLWSLPNAFISPHTADQTSSWINDAALLFANLLAHWIKGGSLEEFAVKKDLGY